MWPNNKEILIAAAPSIILGLAIVIGIWETLKWLVSLLF